MNKKQRMYEAIEKHGENLNVIFNTKLDNVTLSKKLLSIERKAHRAASNLLNTNTLHLNELNRFTGYDVKQATEEEQETFFDAILNRLDKVLNFRAANVPVFINYDARGYSLKIKRSYLIDKKLSLLTDWGGDGILAPDFSGE